MMEVNKIKEARLESGLSQSEFAKLIFNMPVRTLQRWEIGQSKPVGYLEDLIIFYLKSKNIVK